ncbi:MAG: cysteine hydrolase [Alphaproteobacteria bacterium]|nr:cysteine hydrolase [Alphaproteobacteria bacterium]
MSAALLIIDVQKSSCKDAGIAEAIEKAQYDYEHVFASRFVNKESPLIPLMQWTGYDNEELAFAPAPHVRVFDKNVYSSFIDELTAFDEVHLCGYDTDACVYKTALDLIEHNVRPVVLTGLCGSENEHFHQIGLELLKRNIGMNNLK